MHELKQLADEYNQLNSKPHWTSQEIQRIQEIRKLIVDKVLELCKP